MISPRACQPESRDSRQYICAALLSALSERWFDRTLFNDVALQSPKRGPIYLARAQSMGQQIKVELKSKNGYWRRAFHVEWEHQFPDRRLVTDNAGYLLVDSDWLADLQQVGAQVFCHVVRAPDSPQRRRFVRSLIPTRDKV